LALAVQEEIPVRPAATAEFWMLLMYWRSLEAASAVEQPD